MAWQTLTSLRVRRTFIIIIKGRSKADEILQEFAFGLWRLWKNRNDVVFNNVHRSPLEILELWRKNVSDFKEVTAWGPAGERPKCGMAIKEVG